MNTVKGNKHLRLKISLHFLLACLISLAIFLPVYQVSFSVAAVTAVVIPFCYTIFVIHYYFILPDLVNNQTTKAISIVLSILINIVCIVVFSSIMQIIAASGYGHQSFEGFNVVICTALSFIITPVIYGYCFHQRELQNKLFNLQVSFGQTSADLKLLQSQVNPHFLFNVMNTLYGIALQENAVRTASGIEKLSGMMRFMVHDNQQDKIPLSKEIEYLKEFIELQKLRIADLPSIDISHNLPKEMNEDLKITPMLLIPFLENAFKHGISNNKPSWIRIQLDIDQDTLNFNVYNSIHQQADGEEYERNKSSIGLNNVKNRLQLVYPDRHQLRIEQTSTEFFIFLNIHLTDSSS